MIHDPGGAVDAMDSGYCQLAKAAASTAYQLTTARPEDSCC
jgi:hypothetical protein